MDYELLDRVERAARVRSYPARCEFVEAIRAERANPTQRPVGELIGAAVGIMSEPWQGRPAPRGSVYAYNTHDDAWGYELADAIAGEIPWR